MEAFGTESFLARPRRKMFPAVFVVKWMEMGTYPPLLPLQHVRELPEFATLVSLDRSTWPCCLLGHGWLPGLSGLSDKDPGASSFGDLALGELERCLGAFPADLTGAWTSPEEWDADDIALEVSDHHEIWTDGSRKDFSSIGGFEVAGAGVCLPASEVAFDCSVW